MSDIPVVSELVTDPELRSRMLFDPYLVKDMSQKILWGLDHRSELIAMQAGLFEIISLLGPRRAELYQLDPWCCQERGMNAWIVLGISREACQPRIKGGDAKFATRGKDPNSGGHRRLVGVGRSKRMTERRLRVMWLLNHSTTRNFEVPMLKRIGVQEIFLPKKFLPIRHSARHRSTRPKTQASASHRKISQY